MTSCLCFRHVFSSKKKSQETPVNEEQQEEKPPVSKMTTQTKSLKVKLPHHTNPTNAPRDPGTTPRQNNSNAKQMEKSQC
jgi:D-alanyl-D-alanine carboxypeptidase